MRRLPVEVDAAVLSPPVNPPGLTLGERRDGTCVAAHLGLPQAPAGELDHEGRLAEPVVLPARRAAGRIGVAVARRQAREAGVAGRPPARVGAGGPPPPP